MSLWSPEARSFAESQPVARLATADRDGRPHVVPICFALVGDTLCSIIDEKPKRNAGGLKRLRNVAENPEVAVVVDRYDDDWSRLAYALISGRARIVEGGSEHARALERLRAKYPQYRTMKLAEGTHPVIVVDVVRVHYWQATGKS